MNRPDDVATGPPFQPELFGAAPKELCLSRSLYPENPSLKGGIGLPKAGREGTAVTPGRLTWADLSRPGRI
jgi:hypothetical protein